MEIRLWKLKKTPMTQLLALFSSLLRVSHVHTPLLSCDPWFSRHPHCGHKCCDFSWGPAPAQLTSPCVFVKNMRCVEILTLNFTWIQTNRHWHGAGRWFVAVIDNELTDVLEECFQHHYWSGFDDFFSSLENSPRQMICVLFWTLYYYNYNSNCAYLQELLQ